MSTSSTAAITVVKSAADWEKLLRSGDATRLIVAALMGSAAPLDAQLLDLARRYRHVTFAYINVDVVPDVAKQCGVPAASAGSGIHFQFYKNGGKVADGSDMDHAALVQALEQHQGPAPAGSPAGSPRGSPAGGAAGGLAGHVDLAEYIDKSSIECLNQATHHTVAHVFAKNPHFLQSDVDAQLILSIRFTQNVKLSGLRIVAKSAETAPARVRTFVNRAAGLSFDDAMAEPATEILDFTAADYAPEAVVKPLRFVKYQSVYTLTLFIESNLADDDITEIEQLVLYGQPTETSNMRDLKVMGHAHE
ncbi:hypothetical protein CXG81DRAFT_24108 [Caulochytrium protostelioides]|uniref:PITH domain-containing protein n=1 Tax=Caulochytrium protostelioides TaxID=1555241 RepID=A0A4P9XCR0_9FUNG|nr:hypothetical protein CXG81DRAFT_24108 [Caulochytrium protostelioides]|eukprot:RKP03223.1 hypothetical protein CXG81DRAFT_24108 [Caulochytrium protostelioides]